MTVSNFSEMVQRQRSKREHRYVEARLSAHLDGELNESDDRLVRDHLRACQECREELQEIERTVRELRRLRGMGRRDPIVDGLVARLCAGAERSGPTRPRVLGRHVPGSRRTA